MLLACLFISLANSAGNEAEDFNSLGISLTQNGSYDEALINYNMALELDPDYADALDNKGSTLILMGQYDEAESIYDKLLINYPSSSVSLFKKGMVLAAKGDPEAALVYYDKSLFSLKNGSNIDYESHFDIGSVHIMDSQNYQINNIHDFDAREASILYHKAKALESLGRFNDS
jgi:tetratricopeptide (TPR) repeat protein